MRLCHKVAFVWKYGIYGSKAYLEMLRKPFEFQGQDRDFQISSQVKSKAGQQLFMLEVRLASFLTTFVLYQPWPDLESVSLPGLPMPALH